MSLSFKQYLIEKSKNPGFDNDFAQRAHEVRILLAFDKKNRGIGAKTKLGNNKISVRSTGKDHKFYGSRAWIQKESLNEKDDMSVLPEEALNAIKKNIRDGAKDLTQKWANALQLVQQAYKVANVQRPDPTMTGAWSQYTDMIAYAVKELADTRGLDGDWRMSCAIFDQ